MRGFELIKQRHESPKASFVKGSSLYASTMMQKITIFNAYSLVVEPDAQWANLQIYTLSLNLKIFLFLFVKVETVDFLGTFGLTRYFLKILYFLFQFLYITAKILHLYFSIKVKIKISTETRYSKNLRHIHFNSHQIIQNPSFNFQSLPLYKPQFSSPCVP